MMRGAPSRQTGTSAPTASAAGASRASSCARSFARASSRKAAAASAEPPPMPAATGNFFSSTKRPALSPPTRARSAAAALSTRLSAGAPQAAANGPAISSASGRPAPGERVGEVGESDQAFKLVIAVGAAAEHAQCQIDLGGCRFDQQSVGDRHRGASRRCRSSCRPWPARRFRPAGRPSAWPRSSAAPPDRA